MRSTGAVGTAAAFVFSFFSSLPGRSDITVAPTDYNGTEYTYTVKAVNASGAGPASSAATATPKAPPASSVDVTWQCQTLTQTLPWETTMSAALTANSFRLNRNFGFGCFAISDRCSE